MTCLFTTKIIMYHVQNSKTRVNFGKEKVFDRDDYEIVNKIRNKTDGKILLFKKPDVGLD